MKKMRFRAQIKRKSLEIMAHIYDPFHDEKHALEVVKTALQIRAALPPEIREKVDVPTVKLLGLLHDTSRKIIGTNIFLEPLLGGYISGRIAFKLMQEFKYSYEEAAYIRSIIRNHESFYGLWKYPMDYSAQVFADADCVEGYSLQRFKRGLKHFENHKFSNLFLNLYLFGLTFVHKYARSDFFFAQSRALQEKNIAELREFFLKQKPYFKKVLLGFVCKFLYGSL